MINFIKNFRAEESGAVTVDWVVLTAAVVGLGIAVMSVISSSIGDVADDIAENLENASEAANALYPSGDNG